MAKPVNREKGKAILVIAKKRRILPKPPDETASGR
jgi:hypothetical protein